MRTELKELFYAGAIQKRTVIWDFAMKLPDPSQFQKTLSTLAELI